MRQLSKSGVKSQGDQGGLTETSRFLGDQGWRWRVLRTSNAYSFRDPSPNAERLNSSKSEKTTGTENPVLDSTLLAALDRLKGAFEKARRAGQACDTQPIGG